MEITRDHPDWAKAVYDVIVKTIPEAGLGEELRIWPSATWLDGYYAHIVYRKRHLRGLFGLRHDTRVGITGTDWPEPETCGREVVMYALWEPHEDIPVDYDPEIIFWWGDIDVDLPRRLEDIPAV